MTHEKEIPAYALQVARAPKIIPCPAVYHTEKMMAPGERQTVTYQFEEDILVPDIKEDMEEILFMDACCDIMPAERKLSPKTDDFLNFSGTLTIQTLYRPEKSDCLPVSITSKVPYQYQWHLQCPAPAEAAFHCNVKALEHMIINERKFRVKVTLEFTAQMFLEQELSLFQQLEDDRLELKRHQISLCCLETMKKDELQLDGWIEGLDTKTVPKELLQQHYTVIENYRQITSEKIVLNGFLLADFLYRGETEDGEPRLCHQRGRLEFTQFLPLEKKYRGKSWSFVKTDFRHQGLTARLDKNENGVPAFHVEGRLETCITLYEAREQEMVTDAYHQTKQFACSFKKQARKDLICMASSAFGFRDLLQLPEGCRAEEAVCVRCKPVYWETVPEKGRLRLLIKLETMCLWRSGDGYQVSKMTIPLQQTIEAEGMEPSMEAVLDFAIKDCSITLLGDRQIEIAGSLVVLCSGIGEKEILLLENPGFLEGAPERLPAMVITAVEKDEDLWSLAKRHRTTEEQIRKVNQLEGNPAAGQKIFIIR